MYPVHPADTSYQAQQPLLQDEDMAYTILADLKRVSREYATAAMESACPAIRTMFIQMLNNTIRMQGDLFSAMEEFNMYNVSSQAGRQEIDKQINFYQQTQGKTAQYVRQRRQFFQSAPMPQGTAQPGMMQQPGKQFGAGGYTS